MFIVNDLNALNSALICKYIKLHCQSVNVKYERLKRYYEGEHDILKRTAVRDGEPCNNVMHNYAKYISDFASGYLMGEPVTYTSDTANLDDLNAMFKKSQVDVQDMDNAKYQSIYGIAYELIYMSHDESPTPKTASIQPSQAFVIYDNTVELNAVCGVYYYETTDINTQRVNGYVANVITGKEYITFKLTEDFNVSGEITTSPNPFGAVTLIEIWNNNERQGDFEQVISLIDAYNKQQSARVDDVEKFVNSLMVLKGQTLGDTSAEKSETYNDIKKTGVVELTEESSLEFLTRQIDQSGNEILRQSIADDIHKFSNVPSMTDKDFASNVSGVAMKFKLLGLDQMTKIKERYIKEGLRERIKLFSAIMQTKGYTTIDVDDIDITITHSLPVDILEKAQVVSTLQGICSNETLLSQLPFVTDAKTESEKAAEERKRSLDDNFVMPSAAITDTDEESSILD